jgi:hypothetical protein
VRKPPARIASSSSVPFRSHITIGVVMTVVTTVKMTRVQKRLFGMTPRA